MIDTVRIFLALAVAVSVLTFPHPIVLDLPVLTVLFSKPSVSVALLHLLDDLRLDISWVHSRVGPVRRYFWQGIWE